MKHEKISAQLAKHLRDVYLGGNWTISSYKEHLEDVDWKEATTKVGSFNTIATLVFHTGYFVTALAGVLEGKPLTANDKFSFDHPPIGSQQDWEKFLDQIWKNAGRASELIEQLPDSKLSEVFEQEKYGSYFRNIAGITEHLHYHLGQLVIVKRMVKNQSTIS